MKHKIKDMKVRQLQLMGKENVVRAHHKMDQSLNLTTKQTSKTFPLILTIYQLKLIKNMK